MMGFCLPRASHARQILEKICMAAEACDVPKGHLAVYVGETEKRLFIVPIAYLNHQTFQSHAEEEFGSHHSMEGLTIPCREEAFLNLRHHLNGL